MTKLEWALRMAGRGWPVFPLEPNGKRPVTPNGFKDATTSAYKIRWFWEKNPDANIGIATGEVSGIVVVDVDVKNGAKGKESLQSLKNIAPTLIAHTPTGGWHLYYIHDGPLKSRNGALPGIDFKADGGYVVAPGSVIDGKPYEWADSEAHISAITDELLEAFSRRNGSSPTTISEGAIAEGARNSTLTSMAGAMRRRGMGSEEILAALKVVNGKRCSPPLPDKELETIASSIARYPPENDIGPPAEGEEDIRPPGFTDDALALEFTERHAEDWRYVAVWGHWLHWDGACWKRENTLKAFDLSRMVCREASVRCLKPKVAAKVASAATVAAVERLAHSDRKHAATIEQWDTDSWLFNNPGSGLPLKNEGGDPMAKIRPHRREDYATKIAGASPGTHCPTWLNFLADVTNGDVELQHYLARVTGYALTGITTEHVMFFLYGTGANGKSVFLNTLAAVWGDYATHAPIDMFMEAKGERHPTDLAKLRGARLVIATEVGQGRRWDEGKIKALTGGDTISARFMRQDFFDYKPQFKLMIAGNHKPSLRNVDEAMRRRIHLIPFTVTIPSEKRDQTLPERLLSEKDGILGWAVKGCMEWQRIGLKPPQCVLAATEEYFQSQDALGRWIAEECQLHPQAFSLTAELYQSWKAWAEKWGEYVISMKKFSEEMAKREFQKRRLGGKGNQGFVGIALKGQAIEEDLL